MSDYMVDFSINTKKYTLLQLTEILEKRLGRSIGIPPDSKDKNQKNEFGKGKGQKRGVTSWCFYTQAGEKAAFMKHILELEKKLKISGILKKGVIPKDCKLFVRIGYFSDPVNGLCESIILHGDFMKLLGDHKINLEIDFYGD